MEATLCVFCLCVSSVTGMLYPYPPVTNLLPQKELFQYPYMRDWLPTKIDGLKNEMGDSLYGRSVIRPASQVMYGKMGTVGYPSVYSYPHMAPRPLTDDDIRFLVLMTTPIQQLHTYNSNVMYSPFFPYRAIK